MLNQPPHHPAINEVLLDLTWLQIYREESTEQLLALHDKKRITQIALVHPLIMLMHKDEDVMENYISHQQSTILREDRIHVRHFAQL